MGPRRRDLGRRAGINSLALWTCRGEDEAQTSLRQTTVRHFIGVGQVVFLNLGILPTLVLTCYAACVGGGHVIRLTL